MSESSIVEINLDNHIDLLDDYNFMKYCLKRGLLNKDTKVNGRTLMDYAVSSERVNMYALLLKYKVNINTLSNGRTPLFIACMNGNLDLVSDLLICKADPNIVETENFQASPLYVAVWERDIKITRYLLDSKADPNLGSKHGTPLHILACADDTTKRCCFIDNDKGYDMSVILIKAKADTSLKDCNGNTPLTLAINNCNNDIVNLFLESCKITGEQKVDAVMSAIKSNNIDCLKVLKVDKNVIEYKKDGLTPLHLGIRCGGFDCVDYLLSLKANPNCYDDSGVSAIMDAVKMRKIDIVSLLRSHGAKSAGDVVDLACESGNTKIVNALLSRKRKIHFSDVVKAYKK